MGSSYIKSVAFSQQVTSGQRPVAFLRLKEFHLTRVATTLTPNKAPWTSRVPESSLELPYWIHWGELGLETSVYRNHLSQGL